MLGIRAPRCSYSQRAVGRNTTVTEAGAGSPLNRSHCANWLIFFGVVPAEQFLSNVGHFDVAPGRRAVTVSFSTQLSTASVDNSGFALPALHLALVVTIDCEVVWLSERVDSAHP